MIVIIATDTDANALLEPFCAWSAAHLLRPLVVCTASSDAETVAFQVHHGEATTTTLHDALAGSPAIGEPRSLEDLTTVVTKLGSGVAEVGDVGDIAERVVGDLRRIVPPNLWVPPALVTIPDVPGRHCDPDIFSATFDPWIVVAAEDRADAGAVNGLVTPSSDQIARHAAHAIVTLAGGWSFVAEETSFIDDARERGRATAGFVDVVRCYSRLVDGGYFADHVAAEVLRVRVRWPNPDVDDFDDVDLEDEQMQAIADEHARAHTRILDVTPIPWIESGRRHVGLIESVKALFRYVGLRIRQEPGDWFEVRVGDTYSQVADVIKGIGGDVGMPVPDWEESEDRPVVELIDELGRYQLAAADGEVGAAWRDLWALAIGLCDGTKLPSRLNLPFLVRGRRRLLVTDPRRLVPDPEDRPPGVWDTAGFRSCDPRRLDPGVSDPGGADRDPDVAGAASESWLGERQRSLLWKVGVRLAHTAAKARRHARHPGTEEWNDFEEKAQKANTELKELRDKQVVTVGGMALGALPLVGLFVYLGPRWWAWGLPITTVGIVSTIGLALVMIAVYVMTIEDHVQRILAEKTGHLERLLHQLLEAIIREYDVERLNRRYDEYLDWSEILGWFLHRPFAGSGSSELDLAQPIDPNASPEAMRVGLASNDSRQFDLLCQGARTRIFHPSWLRLYYETVREKIVRDWMVSQGVASNNIDSGSTGFDDTSRGTTGRRRYLLMAARRGDHRYLDVNPTGQELLSHLRRLPLEDMIEGTVDLQQGRDRWLAPPQLWTVSDHDLRSKCRAVAPAVVKLEVVGADGRTGGATGFVVRGAGLVVTNGHAVDGAQRVRAKAAGRDWVDAKVAQRAEETDLALLQLEADDLSTCRIESTFDLSVGSSVFTLGYPLLLDGDPTFSRGEITALRTLIPYQDRQIEVFQTSYRATSGSSGSPVFDATGCIVGVHLGTPRAAQDERPADFISLAVPAHELLRFIDDVEGVGGEAKLYERPWRILDDGRLPSLPPEVFLSAIDPPEYGAVSTEHFPTAGSLHSDRIVERRSSYKANGDEAPVMLSDFSAAPAFLEPLRLGVAVVERAEPFHALSSGDEGSDPATSPEGPSTEPPDLL